MKIKYDREADALYIRIQEKDVYCTKEVDEGINPDLDDQGRIIGLEIIGAVERYDRKDIFDIATENLVFEGSEHPVKAAH